MVKTFGTFAVEMLRFFWKSSWQHEEAAWRSACPFVGGDAHIAPQEKYAGIGADRVVRPYARLLKHPMRLMAHGSRSSLSRCMSRYALGRPGAIRGNRFSVSDVGWML